MALDLDIEWDDALALLSEPETGKNVFSARVPPGGGSRRRRYGAGHHAGRPSRARGMGGRPRQTE